MPMQRRRFIAMLLFAADVLGSITSNVDPVRAAPSAASATSVVAQRLERPVSLTWQGLPLSDAFDRLAESESIVFWIDRRVDRSAPVAVSAVDLPVSSILAAVGEPRGAGFTPFAKIVYFGPTETAEELATLAALTRQQLAKAPAAARARWLKPQAWSYPRLSQPRDLLERLAAEAGATVEGAERVPHDLWPARAVPAMAPLDRMVLLLADFDLTCRIAADGSRVEVVPIERPVRLSREYRIPAARAAAVQRLLDDMPGAKRAGEGGRAVIAARWEEHEQLQGALSRKRVDSSAETIAASTPRSRQRPAANGVSEKRFTLKIENQPLAPVLDQLATQLNLQLQWDAGIPDTPEERNVLVSCQVEQVDADGLLQSLLGNAEMTFEREGDVVTIRRR